MWLITLSSHGRRPARPIYLPNDARRYIQYRPFTDLFGLFRRTLPPLRPRTNAASVRSPIQSLHFLGHLRRPPAAPQRLASSNLIASIISQRAGGVNRAAGWGGGGWKNHGFNARNRLGGRRSWPGRLCRGGRCIPTNVCSLAPFVGDRLSQSTICMIVTSRLATGPNNFGPYIRQKYDLLIHKIILKIMPSTYLHH